MRPLSLQTKTEKRRAAILTDAGIKQMEKFLGIANIYEAGGVKLVHHLEQALQAHIEALVGCEDGALQDGQAEPAHQRVATACGELAEKGPEVAV